MKTKLFLKLNDIFRGRSLFKNLRELEDMRKWNIEAIQDYTGKNLQNLLKYAFANVPFYKKFAEKNHLGNNISYNEIFNLLPIMKKSMIQSNLDDLVSDLYRNTRKLQWNYTGGSSGDPMWFYNDTDNSAYNRAVILHNLMWTGYKFGDVHGYIYGGNIEEQLNLSFWQKANDWIMNCFRTNSLFLNDRNLEEFTRNCIKKKARFLICYASSLFEFAHYIKRKGISLSFDFLQSTSECLTDEMREEIEKTFNCKIFDRYGCREGGNIAHECNNHDGLHINWQTVYVEIINKGKYPWLGPDYGDIVFTTLKARGMPFIRYSVEDIGRIVEGPCPCGMNSPRLYLGGARTGDLLVATNGSVCSASPILFLSLHLKSIKKIQFIQHKRNAITVNCIKSNDFHEDEIRLLIQNLHKVLGEDMNVEIKYVDNIEREKSGKYRVTKRTFDIPQ